MRKFLKSAFIILLSLIMAFGGCISVFAEEVTESEEEYASEYDDCDVAKVSGMTFVKAAENSVTISWNENNDDTDGYEVVRVSSSGEVKEVIKTTTQQQIKISGLTQGTVYRYKVRGYFKKFSGKKVYGEYSDMLECTTVPSVTSVKSVKYLSKGKIKVTWKKNSKASGYIIQYSTSSKFKDDGRTVSVTAGKSASSKTISGLAATTYYVRVLPYKKLGNEMYYLNKSGTTKSVKVKSGTTVKERINRINTSSNSGKKAIKKLTNNGVNISKYSTTYDKVMAIYKWHVKHALEFDSCLSCNSNFLVCLSDLFGDDTTASMWIDAGYFVNSNGSKAIHKWGVVYLQGIGYVFDPRMQKYISPSGTSFFALSRSSSLYKKRYTF